MVCNFVLTLNKINKDSHWKRKRKWIIKIKRGAMEVSRNIYSLWLSICFDVNEMNKNAKMRQYKFRYKSVCTIISMGLFPSFWFVQYQWLFFSFFFLFHWVSSSCWWFASAISNLFLSITMIMSNPLPLCFTLVYLVNWAIPNSILVHQSNM